MSKFAFIAFLVLTSNAFASNLPLGYYVGDNNGSSCEIHLDDVQSRARADEYCELDKVKKITKKKIYLKGFNNIGLCKAEVLLDSKGIPTEYRLKERNIISPFYKDIGTCKNLKLR